jgi:hypothetical protein
VLGITTRSGLTTAIVFCGLLSLQLDACSVYKAVNQPSKKNLSVLKPGTSRDRVIAEFGAPVTSEPSEGGRKEIYTFIQGYSKMAKAGRAFFHGAADVFTAFIWEAIGTPIEGAFDGKKISVGVVYDAKDLIATSNTISMTDP